jgi:hypothetical protein
VNSSSTMYVSTFELVTYFPFDVGFCVEKKNIAYLIKTIHSSISLVEAHQQDLSMHSSSCTRAQVHPLRKKELVDKPLILYTNMVFLA